MLQGTQVKIGLEWGGLGDNRQYLIKITIESGELWNSKKKTKKIILGQNYIHTNRPAFVPIFTAMSHCPAFTQLCAAFL